MKSSSPEALGELLLEVFRRQADLDDCVAILQAAGAATLWQIAAALDDRDLARQILRLLLTLSIAVVTAARRFRAAALEGLILRGVAPSAVIGWADSALAEDRANSMLAAVAREWSSNIGAAGPDYEKFLTSHVETKRKTIDRCAPLPSGKRAAVGAPPT